MVTIITKKSVNNSKHPYRKFERSVTGNKGSRVT
jgi:hypothetical protein